LVNGFVGNDVGIGGICAIFPHHGQFFAGVHSVRERYQDSGLGALGHSEIANWGSLTEGLGYL
jgi:hypothetical protein